MSAERQGADREPLRMIDPTVGGLIDGDRMERMGRQFGPGWALALILVGVLFVAIVLLALIAFSVIRSMGEETVSVLHNIHGTLVAGQQADQEFHAATARRDENAERWMQVTTERLTTESQMLQAVLDHLRDRPIATRAAPAGSGGG